MGRLSQRAQRVTEREETEDSLFGVLGERDFGAQYPISTVQYSISKWGGGATVFLCTIILQLVVIFEQFVPQPYASLGNPSIVSKRQKAEDRLSRRHGAHGGLLCTSVTL